MRVHIWGPNRGPKAESQIRVPNWGSLLGVNIRGTGSQIEVPNWDPYWGSILGSILGVHIEGPKSGSQIGVHIGGPYWGSILGVQNGGPKLEFIIGGNCDIIVIKCVLRVTLLPTSCRYR
jgi:hypothetical protein